MSLEVPRMTPEEEFELYYERTRKEYGKVSIGDKELLRLPCGTIIIK